MSQTHRREAETPATRHGPTVPSERRDALRRTPSTPDQCPTRGHGPLTDVGTVAPDACAYTPPPPTSAQDGDVTPEGRPSSARVNAPGDTGPRHARRHTRATRCSDVDGDSGPKGRSPPTRRGDTPVSTHGLTATHGRLHTVDATTEAHNNIAPCTRPPTTVVDVGTSPVPTGPKGPGASTQRPTAPPTPSTSAPDLPEVATDLPLRTLGHLPRMRRRTETGPDIWLEGSPVSRCLWDGPRVDRWGRVTGVPGDGEESREAVGRTPPETVRRV